MKRVLFIDVRNATRSQIAEAWFNQLAVGIAEARSCETMPSEDQVRILRDEIRQSVEQLLHEIREQDLVRMQTSQVLSSPLQPVWN